MKDYFLDSGKYLHWIKTFITPMEQRINSLTEYRKLFNPPYLLLNNNYYKSSKYNATNNTLPIFSNDFLSSLQIFINSKATTESLIKLDLHTGYINNFGEDVDLELNQEVKSFLQGWYVFRIAKAASENWDNFILMPYSATRNVYMPNAPTEDGFSYSVYPGAIDIFGTKMTANWFNLYHRYKWKNANDGLYTFSTNNDKQFMVSSKNVMAYNTTANIEWVYPDHLFVNFLDSNNEEIFLDELSREATVGTENDSTVQFLKITFGHTISNKKIQVF